jgi:hypothetical protein
MTEPTTEWDVTFDLAPAEGQPGVLGTAARELRELARFRRWRGDHSMLSNDDDRLADALDKLRTERPEIHEVERLRDNDKYLRETIAFFEKRLRDHGIVPYGKEKERMSDD